MKYLENQMRSKGYDMKRFMRMVYNTRTYQRASTTRILSRPTSPTTSLGRSCAA